MPDDFSDSEEPIIDLQAKQDELMNLISSSPAKAWQLLQSDPAAVLAITGAKRKLEGSTDENVIEFFEDYDKHVSKIFEREHPIDDYGIALATEFLTEYWRKSISSSMVSSINQAIKEKMNIFQVATDQLPEGLEKTVTSKIVKFSSERVKDYVQYDKDKAKEHAITIGELLNKLVSEAINDDIEVLLSLSYFATASAESLSVMRNHLTRKLLRQLKPKFDDFDEEDKFKIAPYLSVFEKILKEDDQENT